MWGDAAHRAYQAEQEERERAHKAKLEEQAAEVRALLRKAQTDEETARLIEMAKLVGPDGWASRAQTIEDVERTRNSHDANDPVRTMQRELRLRHADLTVRYSIDKARRAIELVRGWGAPA